MRPATDRLEIEQAPARVQQPRRLSRSYIAIWGILAGIALVYLALLALRPDIAELLITGPGSTAPEGNRGQRGRVAAELDELRRIVGRLKGELDQMREAAASRDLREQALAARVGALEAKTAALAEKAGTAEPAMAQRSAPAVAAAAAERSEGLAGLSVKGTVEEQPLRAAGAVLSAPAQKGSAVAVQIGSGPSLDALRLSWQLLQETHRGTLKGLEPRFTETRGDPPGYALLAGPVPDAEAAARICARLKSRRIPCAVTKPAGEPL